MHYTLKSINSESLEELGRKLESSAYNKLPLEINVFSEGGEVMIGNRMLQMIEEHPEKVTFYVLKAMSTAFAILLETSRDVVVVEDSYGMIHKGSWEVRVMDGHVYGDFESFQMDELKKETFNPFFLTDEEKEKYEHGRDIYIRGPRMKKIFEKKKN